MPGGLYHLKVKTFSDFAEMRSASTSTWMLVSSKRSAPGSVRYDQIDWSSFDRCCAIR